MPNQSVKRKLITQNGDSIKVEEFSGSEFKDQIAQVRVDEYRISKSADCCEVSWSSDVVCGSGPVIRLIDWSTCRVAMNDSRCQILRLQWPYKVEVCERTPRRHTTPIHSHTKPLGSGFFSNCRMQLYVRDKHSCPTYSQFFIKYINSWVRILHA